MRGYNDGANGQASRPGASRRRSLARLSEGGRHPWKGVRFYQAGSNETPISVAGISGQSADSGDPRARL